MVFVTQTLNNLAAAQRYSLLKFKSELRPFDQLQEASQRRELTPVNQYSIQLPLQCTKK